MCNYKSGNENVTSAEMVSDSLITSISNSNINIQWELWI